MLFQKPDDVLFASGVQHGLNGKVMIKNKIKVEFKTFCLHFVFGFVIP